MFNKHMCKVYIQLGLIAIVGMPFCGCNNNAAKASSSKKVVISSLEDTKKYAIGVWTGNSVYEGFGMWTKYVINNNGTGELYITRATDSNWGIPSKLKWAPTTGKYSDTGERWYGIEVTGINFPEASFHAPDALGRFLLDDLRKMVRNSRPQTVVLQDSNAFYVSGEDPQTIYKREDIFPFSK